MTIAEKNKQMAGMRLVITTLLYCCDRGDLNTLGHPSGQLRRADGPEDRALTRLDDEHFVLRQSIPTVFH